MSKTEKPELEKMLQGASVGKLDRLYCRKCKKYLSLRELKVSNEKSEIKCLNCGTIIKR